MPDLERAEARASVESSLLTWMAVHGALCLALRHPGMRVTPDATRVISDFRDGLGEMLVATGFLSQAEIDEAMQLEREELQGRRP
jgi:hypothetical protein